MAYWIIKGMAGGGAYQMNGGPGLGIVGTKVAPEDLPAGNRKLDSNPFVARTAGAVLHRHSHFLSCYCHHLPCCCILNKSCPHQLVLAV